MTGGATGIGRAVAIRLAAEGARVAIADTNEARGRETAALTGALVARCDVSYDGEVERAFA
ncbi:MAG: SDR family oxidoreductase, partial [Chloroflexota bacterium]